MEASDILEFQVDRPFHFNWAGKFEAPDEHWMHMSRTLIDFELIVMTKGTLYIAADKEEMVLQAGEYAIICPPCHQYGYRPSDCTFYWAHFVYHDGMDDQNAPLHLLPSQVNAPVNAEDKKILLPMRGSLPRLDRITVLMKQIQDCDRKYRNVSLNDFNISAILCEIYSQLYLSGARTTVKGKKVQLYTDIIDYISWRIHEKIKVSEIAAYFGYNEKYITTFFKKASGLPLKTYILNQKMDIAKAMLVDSNIPVSQVGYDIGFDDNHNFSVAFKKITGQSPTEYRDSYAQQMLFHE